MLNPTRRAARAMMCLLSIVILTGSQSGCDEATFRYVCPALKKYPPEFQAAVAHELATAGPNTKRLISDYGQLRDACRAIEKVP